MTSERTPTPFDVPAALLPSAAPLPLTPEQRRKGDTFARENATLSFDNAEISIGFRPEGAESTTAMPNLSAHILGWHLEDLGNLEDEEDDEGEEDDDGEGDPTLILTEDLDDEDDDEDDEDEDEEEFEEAVPSHYLHLDHAVSIAILRELDALMQIQERTNVTVYVHIFFRAGEVRMLYHSFIGMLLQSEDLGAVKGKSMHQSLVLHCVSAELNQLVEDNDAFE